MSSDLRGDAVLKFETGGEADILVVLTMAWLAELEAMLASASLEQANKAIGG